MKLKKDKLTELAKDLGNVIEALLAEESKQDKILGQVHQDYTKSAQNLIHYAAFRNFDLRSTQKKLRNLGLTRFANAEGHILASLIATKNILDEITTEDGSTKIKPGLSIKKGKRLLTKNTKTLLGYRSKGRRVRIMVTQPTESAYNYALVLEMVKNGMNVARVNCAHDGPEVWEKIITNVRKAAKATGRQVKIAMDLAGPKIRTGQIVKGPKLRKFRPERDISGNIIKPAQLVLVESVDEFSLPNSLPVGKETLAKLKLGDSFAFTDARGKNRRLKVVALEEDHALAHCYETSYIQTGMDLVNEFDKGRSIVIEDMPAIEQAIILRQDDVFTVAKQQIEGKPAVIDDDGNISERAVISCQLPQVFDYINTGDKVLFDDGKIEGKIITTTAESFDVHITLAKPNGSKLKAEKGINFPDSGLGISGLTDKDKQDLNFIATHADIVNFSFVNSVKDVEELHQALEQLEVLDSLDVILKIETKLAVANLKNILLAAMRSRSVGVMIARGDLAIETGWDHIGKIQEEILLLCSAAHVPVVWATQVLENLAKKGLPSRSEITDATAAIGAECIMLNKGPYINRVMILLNTMLSDLEQSHDKKEVMLPRLDNLMN